MSYFGIPIRNGLPIGLGSVAPLASGGGSPFSPLSLFSGGTPGAWYDPSDYSTLFQDSAGTTPVTAVEQPVGLMLDKSQGLVLGSELVTNGDFSNGSTGWTYIAGTTNSASVVSGQLVFTAAGAGPTYATYRQSVLTVGKWYQIEFDLIALGATPGNSIYIEAGGSGLEVGTTLGRRRIIRTAVGTNLNIIGIGGGTIDNISVKELPGNHAFQATSASRPVLSARYNLLTKTEQFNDAVWTKTTGVTGYSTGRITYDGTGVSGWRAYQSYAAITSGLISVVVSGTGTFLLYTNNGDSVSITATSTPTRHTLPVVLGAAGGNLGIFQSGNTAIDVVINFDLRVSNNGITQPAYQRVNTATDYATTGFLPYLKFDGVDDSLSTNSISFTSTDKMSVFAGVRKLSDAVFQTVAELSAATDSNNGSFAVFAPNVAAWEMRLKGDAPVASYRPAPFAAPISNVLTLQGDLAAATVAQKFIPRVNGVVKQDNPNGNPVGTGNFGNYPLYIGRRNNASLPLNGQLYSMVIVGKAVTAGELSSTETYVNQKTGAY